uniref:RING-type E3 ubiquitin transferase n=1 Tax=Kalanchoe fedtschenkoi TaxID=63787 RepID=A0A7N0VJA6_KALFE
MGGCCCCCASGGSAGRNSPVYRYGQRVVEERVPLSPNTGVTPTMSTGLLVDTNLEISSIETYRPPPRPVPYDVDLGHPQTPPITRGTGGNKTDAIAQARGAESVESSTHSTSASTEKIEDLSKGEVKIEIALSEKLEIELSKSVDAIPFVMEEEDVCPTCLEEYDAENPKIMTKCDHHFHLACILEWKERSETCPVCDQVMILRSPIDI